MSRYMKKYGNKFTAFHNLIGTDSPVVVEIGAHYGEDSLRFLETFAGIKLYCFEPDPRNVPIALSDKEGVLPFYPSYQQRDALDVPEKYDWISSEDYNDMALNSSGASSLKPGYKYASSPIDVAAERFDNWYAQANLGKIDLIWIDVQGAEREVVDGMGVEIKNVKYLWIEYGESTFTTGS